MQLRFLGTRGEIELRSRRHRRHSSLLVLFDGARIMIDCGADWLHRIEAIAPTAIVLTHAHSDHAAGLAEGAPCPVYATPQTFDLLRRFPIDDRREVLPGKPVDIDGVRFKACPVEHSLRAPAVGYRISTHGICFFYVPDVARLPLPAKALRGVDLYVGDGATMIRSMVRQKSGMAIGHASIATQLRWCEEAGIHRAIFTHCGSQIVGGDGRRLNAVLRRLGLDHDVETRFAQDGHRLSLAAGATEGTP